MKSTSLPLLIITGPTASGKTGFAARLAYKIGAEIISADSRQVYRDMNLGTGKDYDDYLVEGTRVPYHLVDIIDPGNKYNVYEFQRDFLRVYDNIISRNKIPLVCGGSGMYIDSIVSSYRLIHVPPNQALRKELEKLGLEELRQKLQAYKKLHNKTDTDTVKRAVRAIEIEDYYQNNPGAVDSLPEFASLIIGIKYDRESRRRKISERLRARLEAGMADEVKYLLDKGIAPADLIYYGLEYKYLTMYVIGELSYEEMFSQLETAIHRFAKRQMTWFRGMERRGLKIHWLDAYMPTEEKLSRALGLYKEAP
ncbi:MAG: tRNA (adenosine(37)-N6)-dimethylallyltransferase MiaA [Marinilabiliaceae bacterium]|jgi:tRNA dimethylallyltransferase|nr:tRNA (adenosine(37)-N6)-dimethylallyltransferase MiaA [Marinilabiliaceae bacterium]